MRFGGSMSHGPRKNSVHFGVDPNNRADQRVYRSLNFANIARYSVWPWWRSALNNAKHKKKDGSSIAIVELR